MIELNCLGLACPQPIIALAKELRKLEPGEGIILISDDSATEKDLNAWSRMTGNMVETLGVDRFKIIKS